VPDLVSGRFVILSTNLVIPSTASVILSLSKDLGDVNVEVPRLRSG
jgi:hypothetical protein